MILFFDTETNGLVPSVLHCIAIKVQETGEKFLFADHPGYLPIKDGIALLESGDFIIGHNSLGYDLPVLERLCGLKIDHHKVIDTLPLIRKFIPNTADLDGDLPPELRGKHSIKAWGRRLNLHKGDFGETADWLKFSDEMVDYCERDVDILELIYTIIEEFM